MEDTMTKSQFIAAYWAYCDERGVHADYGDASWLWRSSYKTHPEQYSNVHALAIGLALISRTTPNRAEEG